VLVAKKDDAPPATTATPLSAVTLPVTATEAAVTAPITLTVSKSGSLYATPIALVLGIFFPLKTGAF
jgi:hypothetical protein